MKPSILRSVPTTLLMLVAAASWAARETPRDNNPTVTPPSGPSFLTAGGGANTSAATALTPIRAYDVATAVQRHVAVKTSENLGWYRIHDPLDGASLTLKLESVSAGRLLRVDARTFVTAATLTAADGTPYTVDFYVRGTTRKDLKVVEATIHAKAGIERYAWANEKGLMRVMPLSSELPMREELAH